MSTEIHMVQGSTDTHIVCPHCSHPTLITTRFAIISPDGVDPTHIVLHCFHCGAHGFREYE